MGVETTEPTPRGIECREQGRGIVVVLGDGHSGCALAPFVLLVADDSESAMRLQPIDEPKGLMMRLAFWFSRRHFGKIVTPMRVLYPRVPQLLKVSFRIQQFEMKGLTLDTELHHLLAAHISQVNGCEFCSDLTRALAIREHIG